MTLITAEELRAQLRYEPETGKFYAIAPGRKRLVGHEVGTYSYGYHQIGVGKKKYLAHRLAFLWMTGEWPPACVDHIDMNRANNSWTNLRLATKAQNNVNANRPRNNTSGYVGVRYAERLKKWRAYITVDRRQKHLGVFETMELASEFRQLAAKMIFGEFARTR